MKSLERELNMTREEKNFESKSYENSQNSKENEELYIDLEEPQPKENSKIADDDSNCNRHLKLKAKSNAKCRWTQEEEKKLMELTKEKHKDWDFIASHFPNKNRDQCYTKYSKVITKFKKGKWTEEEDQKIFDLIKKHHFNWKTIAANFQERSLTQIKQRYINCLDPLINKNKFTEEEDSVLLKKFAIYGPDWKKISKFFTNRPSNMIKNRYYTKIRNQQINREKNTRDHKTTKTPPNICEKENETLEANMDKFTSFEENKNTQTLSLKNETFSSKLIETEGGNNSVTYSECSNNQEDYMAYTDKAQEEPLLSKKRKRISETKGNPKILKSEEPKSNLNNKDNFDNIHSNSIEQLNGYRKRVKKLKRLIPLSKSSTIARENNFNSVVKLRKNIKKKDRSINIINHINNITINDCKFIFTDNQAFLNSDELNKDMPKRDFKSDINGKEYFEDFILYKTNNELKNNNNNIISTDKSILFNNSKPKTTNSHNLNCPGINNKNAIPNNNPIVDKNSNVIKNENYHSIKHNNSISQLNETMSFLENSNRYFNLVIAILEADKVNSNVFKKANSAQNLLNKIKLLELDLGKSNSVSKDYSSVNKLYGLIDKFEKVLNIDNINVDINSYYEEFVKLIL